MSGTDRPGQHGDDAALGRLYRSAAGEMPPSAVDARILAEARAATEGKRAAGRGTRRWVVPLSLAATMLLGVGVALRLWDRTASEPVRAPQAPAILIERSAAGGVTAESAPAPSPETPMREGAASGDQRAADAGPAALAFAKTSGAVRADVVSVTTSGEAGAYQFSVGVRSTETGCGQYADWWEVVSTEGKLLYRRVFLHSHVDEQPFVRSGGPVPVGPDTVVWVRAHMNTGGYGGAAFRGSVAQGFAPASLPPDFAAGLAQQSPQPQGCAF